MAVVSNNKLKLIYLSRYLLQNTDEDHPASMADILSMLEDNGISAERKSVYDDIEALKVAGYDVLYRRESPSGYYIGSREFELPESFLQMMMEDKQLNLREAKNIRTGDEIDLGGRTLEVLEVPGHTPGSIALLDRTHRFLISGDTVQSGCIFMHGEGRDLSTFRSSIEKMDAMRREGLFDTVFPSHGEAVIPADILADHLALADDILSGTAVPVGPAPDWFPDTVKVYRHNRAQMYYAD